MKAVCGRKAEKKKRERERGERWREGRVNIFKHLFLAGGVDVAFAAYSQSLDLFIL